MPATTTDAAKHWWQRAAWRKAMWFAALWLAGVASVAAVAYGLRAIVKAMM
ncbi:MAG: hypothetical protein ABI439_02195 [Rhodospirillales bacterium]